MDFSTYFYTNSEFLFPEIFLSLSFIGLIFYGGIALYEPWLLTRYMNKISLCVTGILILLILNSSFSSQSFLSISFFQDLSTLWVKLFLFVSVFCCFILFENSTHQFFEFSILILLSLFGTILLIMSFDLISLYLAIELQSLCFYILASLKKNSAYSTEAGLKYFILGALTSGLLLFGCSLIYGAIGTTNFEHFTNLFINFNDHSPLLIIGSLFILIAIFFKLAAAPFHNWSPDVY